MSTTAKDVNGINMIEIALLLILLLMNCSSVLSGELSIEEQCGRYGDVLTNDPQVSRYLAKSNSQIQKVIVRKIVSPENYRSVFDEMEAQLEYEWQFSRCFNFWPIRTQLAGSFRRNEALFIQYSSKLVYSMDDPISKDMFLPIELEVKSVFSEVKMLAKNLSLNFVVIRPAVTITQNIDGKETTLRSKMVKDFKFYTLNHRIWQTDN